MRFYEFILEDFKTAKLAFASQGADLEDIDNAILTYRDLTRKNQFQRDEKNIDWWVKQGWEAFKQRVNIVAQTPTKTALKRSKIEGNAIELSSSNPDWEIYIPLDKAASCNIGSGTDWCTAKAKHGHFENYFYDRAIILVYVVGNNTKYAIAMHDQLNQMEFYTKHDASISQSAFEARTKLTVDDIRSQTLSHFGQISAEQKSANIKDPIRALKFAKQTGKPFPEGETVIASSAETAFEYARDVLHGRFERAEPIIMREPSFAVLYAKQVIGDRWVEAEPAIAQRAKLALHYARYVIKGPWPMGEKAIATDHDSALTYVVRVLHGRFPLYEPFALTRAATAWEYIRWAIKGPWPEAEPILKTSSQYTRYYENLIGKKL